MNTAIYKIKSNKLLNIVAMLSVAALPFMSTGVALAASVDSSVPTLSISSPSNGATVSGMVSVLASAADVFSSCVVTVSGGLYDVSSLKSTHPGGDIFVCGTDMTGLYQAIHGTDLSRLAPFALPVNYSGVATVEFYVDGVLKSTDASVPYSYTLNTVLLSNGSHTLLAKAYDQAGNVGTSATVNVTVNNVVTPVLTSISLTPATSSVVVGATQQFTAVAKDQNGVALSPQPTITYTSSDTSKATVSSTGGLATGVAVGSVVVTASSGSVSSTATLTVTAVPPNRVLTTVVVTPTITSLTVGGSTQLTATALDQFGEPITVALLWNSSNTSVATVNSNGVVTAVSAGTTTITATSGSVSGNATVTVVAPSSPPPSSNTRILVEMNLGDGKSEVKIKMAGSELEFKLFTTNKTEIVDAIAGKTGLSVSTILSVAEFKIDGADDGNEDENRNGNGHEEDEHEDENISRRENSGGKEHEDNDDESVNVGEGNNSGSQQHDSDVEETRSRDRERSEAHNEDDDQSSQNSSDREDQDD